MVNFSGKQCKTARLLLKWNLRELEFRSTIRAEQIDLFERGQKQLQAASKESLLKTFRKEGVEFLEYGEVRLEGGEPRTGSLGRTAEQQVYSVRQEDLLPVASAGTASRRPGPRDAEDPYAPAAD